MGLGKFHLKCISIEYVYLKTLLSIRELDTVSTFWLIPRNFYYYVSNLLAFPLFFDFSYEYQVLNQIISLNDIRNFDV